MKVKKKTIDDKIKELYTYKVIFEDEANFRSWLFEYACQTLEYQKINTSNNIFYLKVLQKQKVDNVIKVAKKIYESNHMMTKCNIPKLPLDVIPQIVRTEHQVGGCGLTKILLTKK